MQTNKYLRLQERAWVKMKKYRPDYAVKLFVRRLHLQFCQLLAKFISSSFISRQLKS